MLGDDTEVLTLLLGTMIVVTCLYSLVDAGAIVLVVSLLNVNLLEEQPEGC